MYLVWIGSVCVVLKVLGVGPLAALSWWWVLAPLGAAVVWFEGLERLLGRDRRKVDGTDWERRRRERIARQFGGRASRR